MSAFGVISIQEEKITMNVTITKTGTTALITVSGKIDTTTAPELEAKVKPSLEGVTELTFDFKDVDYVSSAGLRVILSTQKIMTKQGSMKIVHVNESVMEIFEVTGFLDILTIE